LGVGLVINTCEEWNGNAGEYQKLGIEQIIVETIDYTPPELEQAVQAVEAMNSFLKSHPNGKVFVFFLRFSIISQFLLFLFRCMYIAKYVLSTFQCCFIFFDVNFSRLDEGDPQRFWFFFFFFFFKKKIIFNLKFRCVIMYRRD
jgi:hypothetical protein